MKSMPSQPASAPASSHEILHELAIILASDEFLPSRQLSRFLQYAVEHAVSNRVNELKETIIGIEVFERGKDFDPRVDSIVRVQASNLRKRLAAFYAKRGDTPTIIIDLPPGSYVPKFRQPGLTARHKGSFRRMAALGPAGAIIAAIALVSWLTRPTSPEWVIEQLTFDTGFSGSPAISGDGRFVVYSSNRADAENTDLWVHPLDGSLPRRLTTNLALDHHPDISPDGEDVVFRSYRNPAGVYIVNLRTGAERLVAAGGFSPRFSPDGNWIAFSSATGRGTASVFVVPFSGGEARDIVLGANSARGPLWTPDGRYVLYLDSLHGHSSDHDWWTVPFDHHLQRAPTRTRVRELLARQQLPGLKPNTFPQAWYRDRVVFTVKSGKQAELWTVMLAGSTFRATGRAKQFFPGPGVTEPGTATEDGDKVVFARAGNTNNLWAVPVSNGLRADGAIRQLTHDESLKQGLAGTRPSITPDATFLVFPSGRYGHGHTDLWLKRLNSGEESALTREITDEYRPVLDAQGIVAFNRAVRGATAVDLLDTATGRVRRLCQDCGELADISQDGRRVLAIHNRALVRIDVDSGSVQTLLADEEYGPEEAAYSPDARWISLATYVQGKDSLHGYVLPAETPADPRKWIKVTEENYHLSLAWSPQGDRIYYFSTRDEHRCLYSQEFQSAAGHIVGSPVAIEHFHDPQFYPWSGSWIAAAHDSVVVNLSSGRSNIYLAKRKN